MMPFIFSLLGVGVLWLLFFLVLNVVQRAQDNVAQARRLQRRINQIASAKH